ncbi:hypothetical protein VTJ04DRAFT_6142 [Mycothermus thermophilus]|uniref:uncharacterized protein n=1 Tax=Humicola insolens TaxID=85995 RepID=UPI00374272FB
MSTPLGGNRAKRKPNPLTFTGGSNIAGPSNTNTTTGNNPIAAAQWYDDTDPANHHHHHRRQSQIPTSHQTETVGTLLASIANCMNEALRILMFADKRHWGPDEFEQTRALEDALDEAKRDFQALGKLVNGRWYYEHDRTPDSLHHLSHLLTQFEAHLSHFRAWAQTGGPINPAWTHDTLRLRRLLHRAQCRAAGRVFAATTAAADAEASPEGGRCLGAFLVRREQKRLKAEKARREKERAQAPAWKRASAGVVVGQEGEGAGGVGSGGGGYEMGGRLYGTEALPGEAGADHAADDPKGKRPEEGLRRIGSLEALIPTCNEVGRFHVLRGDNNDNLNEPPELRRAPNLSNLPTTTTQPSIIQHDAAFVCDFCSGYIVWRDLLTVPSSRSPLPPTAVTGYPHWQSRGVSAETNEAKTVVFPPVAIANHAPPGPGMWQAPLMCPYCDYNNDDEESAGQETYYLDEGAAGAGEMRYVREEAEAVFEDVEALQRHLEWYHTALPVPPIKDLAGKVGEAVGGCVVM